MSLLFHRFPQLLFDYTDPSPRFDRTCVKGPVAKLVRVNDVSTATALEVTAGGRVSVFTYNNITLYALPGRQTVIHYTTMYSVCKSNMA